MSGVAVEEAGFVSRAQQGDQDAFRELYDAYFERIYDFAYQLVRNRADAEDVTSEVFLKAIERLEGLRDPEAFRGWLYAIARNAALNLIERRKRTTAMPEDYDPAPPAPAAESLDPAFAAERVEVTRLVWEAATTLNPRDYSIFEMTVRQGLEPGEVAIALGVKPSHAYVLISRLKDTVEDALGAVILARTGRRDCSALDAIVERFGDERSPRMRKAVVRHMRGCDDCQRSRKRYASAAAILGGVAAALPAAGLKEELAAQLVGHWTTKGPGRPRRGLRRARALTMLLALIAASLLVLQHPSHPLALVPSPTPTIAPTSTETPAPTPLPTLEPTPEPTLEPVATRAPRRTPTLVRPQATPVPTPEPTRTPVIITITPEPTRAPDPTPAPCPVTHYDPNCPR